MGEDIIFPLVEKTFLGGEYIFHGEKHSYTTEKRIFHTVKHYFVFMMLTLFLRERIFSPITAHPLNIGDIKKGSILAA